MKKNNNIEWLNTNKIQINNPGIFTILQVVFIVLKLTNLINWSWWWVLSPIWISIAVIVTVVLIVLAVVGCGKLGSKIGEKFNGN